MSRKDWAMNEETLEATLRLKGMFRWRLCMVLHWCWYFSITVRTEREQHKVIKAILDLIHERQYFKSVLLDQIAETLCCYRTTTYAKRSSWSVWSRTRSASDGLPEDNASGVKRIVPAGMHDRKFPVLVSKAIEADWHCMKGRNHMDKL